MKGVLLAGGTGTRMMPYSMKMPKQLLSVDGKPVLLHGLEQMRDAGILDIAVILGENRPGMVRALLGDGRRYGVSVTYIVQGAARGIAHAIGCAREFVGTEPFCVYLGDVILRDKLQPLVQEFESSKYSGMILLAFTEEPWKYGVAELDDNGKLVQLVEKPQHSMDSNLALVGVYFFRDAVFDVIRNLKPSSRGELEITDAIWALHQDDGKVQPRIVTGWSKGGWYKSFDSKEDLEEANS